MGITGGTMLGDVYYDPQHETAFGTLEKLKRVAKKTDVAKPSEVKPWLEQQDAYTLHRQVRKRFARNPYSFDIMDVWECDLIDVQALSRHNDGIKYLLTVIDVFSKFLHMVPLKSKSGKDVSAAFQSVLKDPRYLKPFKRRPVWVRTDKGKEFLNESFQKLLKREGIQFQVFRNPDIKCSIVERVQRTVRDKLCYSFINLYSVTLHARYTNLHVGT